MYCWKVLVDYFYSESNYYSWLELLHLFNLSAPNPITIVLMFFPFTFLRIRRLLPTYGYVVYLYIIVQPIFQWFKVLQNRPCVHTPIPSKVLKTYLQVVFIICQFQIFGSLWSCFTENGALIKSYIEVPYQVKRYKPKFWRNGNFKTNFLFLKIRFEKNFSSAKSSSV